MDKKFDLNEKINLIYNFNYNDEFASCVKINKFNHKNIKLDDIKISEKYKDSIYNLSDEVFKEKTQLLEYNDDNNTIILKRYSNNFPVTLFIKPYNSENDSMIIEKNSDQLYSYLLSSLVLRKKTNHILLPIVNMDVRFNQFHDVLKNESFYSNLISKITNKKHSDLFSVNIKEHFLNSESLTSYLKKNKYSIKNLLFQVIHTLAVIQKEYPNFRHNALNTSNVFLYLFDENINHKYKFNNEEFVLDKHNFDIKITNFYKSSIRNELIKKIPFSEKKNRYFDLHYFLNTLLYKNKINNFDSETDKFLMKILPKKVRGKGKNNYYLEQNIELFKPSELLKDKYFESLKNKKYTNKKSHSNYMKKYTLKQNTDHSDIFGKQNDLVIKGNRKLNIKKIKKNIIKNKKLTRKLNMKGGSFLSKLPTNQEKNDPFISNDNKNVFKKKKREFTKTYPEENVRKINKENNPFDSQEKKKNYERIKDEDEEKKVYNKKSDFKVSSSSTKNKKLLAEQKVYDISKPPRQVKDEHPVFVPVDQNNNPYYGHIPNAFPYTHVPNRVPIQKIYNIGLAKPNIEHATLSRVYEDVLPGEQYNLSFNSIKERKQLINFIRNIILNKRDGEVMNITIGDNSLLSYLKLIQLNPYAVGKHPYKELSKGFLLYNAAYPIRHNSVVSDIDIAKGASGVNVRIYELSIGALRAKTISKFISYDNFEVWREIKYYEYIKNNILLKKQSPNFINLLLYKTDEDSKINWNKLNNLIYNNDINILHKLEDDEKKINKKHNIKSGSVLFEQFMGNEYFNELDYFRMNKKNDDKLNPNNEYYYWRTKGNSSDLDVIKYSRGKYYVFDHVRKEMIQINDIKIDDSYTRCLNLNECLEKMNVVVDSGKSLVAVTEAPTTNLLAWASPQYKGQGAVKKMISTGHHSSGIWESLLFQFVYIFAVLKKHNIYFRNMSIEKNFFVKDLFSNPSNVGHWIYKIDQIDFYIPNNGHLLVFDSSYVDKKIDPLAGFTFNEKLKTNENDEFKIYSSKIFSNNGMFNEKDINDLLYISFKEMIKIDNFKNLFKNNGANIDEKVLNLLNNIYNDDTKDFSKLLIRHFPKFLNNRIGTLLKESEVEKINLLTPPKFDKKKLVVIRERFQVYKWALYLEDSGDHKKKVLVKENNNFVQKDVYTHSIINYPDTVNITPYPYKKLNLETFNLIEEYKL
jgi:hypothetical protein